MADLLQGLETQAPKRKKLTKHLEGMRDELLKLRRVPFEGSVNEARCRTTAELCAALVAGGTDLPVTLLINSEGGDMRAADRLLDRLDTLGVRLSGVMVGRADSAALDIFLRCYKRGRFVLPRSRALPHFAFHEARLVARSLEELLADAERFAKSLWRYEERGRKWMCERTGLSPEELVKILQDGDKLEIDLDAEELVQHGFAHGVLEDFDLKKPHPKLEPWHESFQKKAEPEPPPEPRSS